MCNTRLYGKIRETIVCSYSTIVCCNLAYETLFYASNITLSLSESCRASASAIVSAVYCIITLSGTDMAVFLSDVVASIIRGVIRVGWVWVMVWDGVCIYLFQLEVFNAKLLSMQVTATAILCLLYILPDPKPFIIDTARGSGTGPGTSESRGPYRTPRHSLSEMCWPNLLQVQRTAFLRILVEQ